MPLYLDHSFLERISSNFEGFQIKRSNPYLAVCRCFICGDSQKSKIKKRGYFFQKTDNILFTCHNCGVTRSIKSILKASYQHLYQDYILQQFETNKPLEIKERQPKFEFIPKFLHNNNPLKQLQKISDLSPDHKAYQFLSDRMIPKEKFKTLYYCENFPKWINSMIPEKLDERYSEDRLVIPYLNGSGQLTGVNGRAFDSSSNKRYIAIMFVEDALKVYNYYSVDFDVTNFVVEGQLDSMFLSNSCAMAGSSINLCLLNRDTSVIAMDCEPRNYEICKQLRKIIDKGYKVVIWPSSIKQKDINLMILAGINVKQIIKQNTFQGQQALLQFQQWTKCKNEFITGRIKPSNHFQQICKILT